MKTMHVVLMSLVGLLFATSVLAAKNDVVGIDPSRIPVKITSERMVYNETGKTVTFTGNVIAEHGELTLWSDKLTAYLSSKDEKGTNPDAIDHIIAEGNVRAKRGKSEGTCGKLTYVVDKQFLKMEQNPVLKDGRNSLSGKIINYYALENRSEVVGGKGQRVKAIFQTPAETKGQ